MAAAAAQWIADANSRLTEHIEKAVASAHFKMVLEFDGKLGTEAAVAATALIVELWNEEVDRIDAKYGKGFFGLRLGHAGAYSIKFMPEFPGGESKAFSALLFLSSMDRTPIIDWMYDLMIITAIVSEDRIQDQAFGKDQLGHNNTPKVRRLWDGKLRKQIQYQALARIMYLRDQIAGIAEKTESDKIKRLYALQRHEPFYLVHDLLVPPVTSPGASSHPGTD
jgi:hypothetical protein